MIDLGPPIPAKEQGIESSGIHGQRGVETTPQVSKQNGLALARKAVGVVGVAGVAGPCGPRRHPPQTAGRSKRLAVA